MNCKLKITRKFTGLKIWAEENNLYEYQFLPHTKAKAGK